MKAIIEFNLPEDNYEYNITNNASKYLSVLFDYDQWLRSKLKYDDVSGEELEIIQKCRDMLHQVLQENNVNIDDIF
jgi:hypothetical protein